MQTELKPSMDRSFIPGIAAPESHDPGEQSWWFIFRGSELVIVDAQSETVSVPLLADLLELAIEPLRHNYLGVLTRTT